MDDYYWCEKCRNRSSARFANSEPICWGCGGDMEWREGKASKLERIVVGKEKRIKELEASIRDLLSAVDSACRLASNYKIALEPRRIPNRDYTEQYRFIDKAVRKAEEVLGDERVSRASG